MLKRTIKLNEFLSQHLHAHPLNAFTAITKHTHQGEAGETSSPNEKVWQGTVATEPAPGLRFLAAWEVLAARGPWDTALSIRQAAERRHPQPEARSPCDLTSETGTRFRLPAHAFH